MSIERCLNIKISHWRRLYCTPIRALIVCIIIFFVFFVLNIHLAFTLHDVYDENNTIVADCQNTKTYKVWRTVSIKIYETQAHPPFVV